MPYIHKDRKQQIDVTSSFPINATPGDLNYALHQVIDHWLVSQQVDVNYTQCNSIVGALECVKLEIYRRIVAPYENKMINKNGDVEPYESFCGE
jgi:hypothetical protein